MKLTTKINRFLKAFNGKKTTIGAVLLFLAAMPHISNVIGVEIVDVIQYIGLVFTGVGVTHKAIKAAK